MKKTILLIAAGILAAIGGLGLNCYNVTPDPENDFEIKMLDDTLITATAEKGTDFHMDIKNLTNVDLPIKVDTLKTELPEKWYITTCDESKCYPLPIDTTLKAGESWQKLHFSINPDKDAAKGAEGKIVVTVAATAKGKTEVDTVNLKLQIK